MKEIVFKRPDMAKWKIRNDFSKNVFAVFPEPTGCVSGSDGVHIYANAGDHEAFDRDITLEQAEKLVEERLRALANAVAVVIHVRYRDHQKAIVDRGKQAYETWRQGLTDGTSNFDDLPRELQQAWLRVGGM